MSKAGAQGPDVYLMVDRRTGSCLGQDGTSLPKSAWSSAKDVLLLPGGKWSVLRDWGEVDQASPQQLAGFVRRALARFPPSPTRK